jgi:hypothetical protein
MPNWCENDLTITGPSKDVDAFFEFAKGKMKPEDGEEQELLLDFNKFVPMPETITRDMITEEPWRTWMEDTHRGDDELWWYWRVQHWGTKWQPQGCQFTEDGWDNPVERCETITFDTAWSPPLPVVLAMSKKFPTLEFDLRYFESGCAFNGMYVCKGGEVTCEEEGPYFGNRGG